MNRKRSLGLLRGYLPYAGDALFGQVVSASYNDSSKPMVYIRQQLDRSRVLLKSRDRSRVPAMLWSQGRVGRAFHEFHE